MELSRRGVLYLWHGRIIFATNAMQTDFHEHYAATLAISLKKEIQIETARGTESYRAALVGPNTYHRTVSPGVEMVALLIDPETYEFGSIADLVERGAVRRLDIAAFQHLMDRLWDAYYGQLSDAAAWDLHLDLLRSIYPFRKLERNLDERIREIARRIRTELPDSIRMKEIGRGFAISEDRLVRLFKENMGIPLRRYLLWVRILKASRLLKDGMSITDVAHAAGFSDSAHFTRTFKENFGFVPSLFFGHLRTMDVRFCESDELIS